MKAILTTTIALLVLSAVSAESQMSTAGEHPYQKDGVSQDPTDAPVRYQNGEMGKTIEEWAGHLQDHDPGRRLAALKLLAQSGDAKANQYLIGAVDSPDQRIATYAVDYLGKRAAKEASETLSEKLFLAGTNPGLRQHVLAALGRIRDPASARRVLAFEEGESDPELRAAAIRAIGEIGDDSVRGDLQKLSDKETDPKLKIVFEEAVTNISSHGSALEGVKARSEAVFSHSEARP